MNETNDEDYNFNYIKTMKDYQDKIEKETESIDVSVEEENMIIDKIKKDILNQVRDEMKSELDLYKIPTDRTISSLVDLENDEHLDPEIRKGLYQIRKLDKILLNKMKQEKKVKRERILLQKRYREELENVENDNQQLSKEIKSNVFKFLALKPPPRHNEGMNEENAEDMYPQLFQTELDNEETKSVKRESPNISSSSQNENIKSGKENTPEKTPKKDTDFIKRNIELAGKANDPIVLTDQEQNRLNQLLEDLDSTKEEDLESLNSATMTNAFSMIEDNPFRVASIAGSHQSMASHRSSSNRWASRCSSMTISVIDNNETSLMPQLPCPVDPNDETRLTSLDYQLDIEGRLRLCLGEDRYRALTAVPDSHDSRGSISVDAFSDDISVSGYRKSINTGNREEPYEELGEEVLKEVKFNRESQQKLIEIDNKLIEYQQKPYDPNENEELDPIVLRELLNGFYENNSSIPQGNLSRISEIDGEEMDENRSSSRLHSDDSIITISAHDESSISSPKHDHPILSEEALQELLKDPTSCTIFKSKTPNSIENIVQESQVNQTFVPLNRLSEKSFDHLYESPVNSDRNNDSVNTSGSRFPDINLYKQLTGQKPK